MAKESCRRSYSIAEREEAVRRTAEVGPRAAARELGIPPGTLSRWLLKRGQSGRSALDGRAVEGSGVASTGDGSGAPALDPDPAPDPKASRRARSDGEVPVSAAATARPTVESNEAVARVSPGAEDPGLRANDAPKRAQGAQQVARVYTPSERARILEYAAREGPTAATKEFDVSRFSIYEWRRRTRLHAEGKAKDSPVVGSDEDVTAARDRRILAEWKAHPGLGPSQVRNQLRRQGMKVSIHTVRCVLDANGYVAPKVRREAVHDQRYEAVRPNHIWHLDFLHRYVHKQKIYVLLILDDHSRFIVGGAIWDGERVAAVQETFLASVGRHGRPEKVMSDGGSAFHAWRGIGEFTRLVEELEIDQLIATIPQVNSKTSYCTSFRTN